MIFGIYPCREDVGNASRDSFHFLKDCIQSLLKYVCADFKTKGKSEPLVFPPWSVKGSSKWIFIVQFYHPIARLGINKRKIFSSVEFSFNFTVVTIFQALLSMLLSSSQLLLVVDVAQVVRLAWAGCDTCPLVVFLYLRIYLWIRIARTPLLWANIQDDSIIQHLTCRLVNLTGIWLESVNTCMDLRRNGYGGRGYLWKGNVADLLGCFSA